MVDLRKRLERQLIASTATLPTGKLSRLGKTAVAVLRGAGAWRRDDAGRADEVEERALARWIASIGELKGIAMKVGQILSYIDVAMPEEVQRALSVLQTHAQPMSPERVAGMIHSELGDRADTLLAQLSHPPIAAASIGQVHRAVLRSGRGLRQVAVKVQYPEVEEAIRADLAYAALGPIVSSLIYPGVSVAPLIEEARARLLEECDYLHEAAMQTRFRELFREHPTLLVPEVLSDYTSRHVLTTEFVPGHGFEQFLASAPAVEDRDRIGKALFEFYVGSLFQHRVYNCDPHPGNYLFLNDGRVAMLDHGCAREFGQAFVERLARLTLAAHADASDDLCSALQAFGIIDAEGALFDTARALLLAYFGPTLYNREQAIDLGEAIGMRQALASKRQLMKLHLPGEFLFLFRIRFGLLSVLARLGARANWSALEVTYASSALGDLSSRQDMELE